MDRKQLGKLQLGKLQRMRRGFLFQSPINWTGYYATDLLVHLILNDQDGMEDRLDQLDLESQK
jgi:hypothetical protein